MNDVRGAMERYRAHVAGVNAMIHPRELPYTYIDETTGAGGMVQEAWERDAHRLALAYLTEHAADDDEPVTEEWLWSVGFRESLGEYELTHRHDDIHVSSIVLHPKWGWRVGSGSANHQSLIKIANQPTTRGSVRRLAAALGIQLKGEQ